MIDKDPYNFGADQPNEGDETIEDEAMGELMGYVLGLSNAGMPYTQIIGILRTTEHVLINTHCSVRLGDGDES